MSSVSKHRLSLASLSLVALVVATLLTAQGSAAAVSAAVSPSQQTIESGETGVWGAAWGEQAPYAVTCSCGDGGSWSTSSTSTTSRPFDRTFITCSTRSYMQRLDVREINSSATIMATTSTSVIADAWCRR